MASTIAQLIMEQGRQSAESRTELAKIAANALTSNASAAAEAARQKGAIWGGAINQIGQSIAAIPGNIQHQKSLDLQQQDIQAQIAERQSLAQERQAKVAQEQRAESDAKLFDAAMSSATDPETGLIDVKSMVGKVPAQLLEKNIPIIDTHNKALTAFNDAKDTALSSQFLRAYISGDPNTLASAGQSGAGIGLMKPEDAANLQQIADAIKSGPQVAQKPSTQAISVHVGGRLKAFQPMLQHYLDEQGKQAKQTADTREANARAADLENPKPISVAPGGTLVNPKTNEPVFTAPEKPPAPERPAPFTLSPGETRYDPTGKPIASMPKADDPALNLTPDAKKLTAHQYAMTGQLPPMGMGKEGAKVRTEIINEAARIYQGLDLPSQQAAFKANQASLTKLQGTADKVSAFESTAGKNLDQFLSLAEKIPDTGVPWVNTPIRAVNAKMVGDTNQAAFNAARDVALREIARVTSDPNLTGVLSDSARREVQSLSPENATFGQIKAVAKVLKQDMANVKAGLSDQITDVRQRIATPPGGTAAPAAAGPAVGTVRSANGETRKWTGSEWVLVK